MNNLVNDMKSIQYQINNNKNSPYIQVAKSLTWGSPLHSIQMPNLLLGLLNLYI